MLTRRAWISLALAGRSLAALAADDRVLDVTELPVPHAGRFGQKCLLLRPARVDPSRPLPLLILFHGLGETGNETLGIHAWYERYGVTQAYARLASATIERTLPRERYLSDARTAEFNRELARKPFRDLVLVCPYTPNVWKQPASALFLERYADYVEQAVLPAVRAATPIALGPAHVGLDGVSLGGYVALEVFQRRPQSFGAVGSMQGAFSVGLAERYAARLAEIVESTGTRRIHLTTSSQDPFRDATLRLARRLRERGVEATLSLPDGPHDQRFLREVGSLEMLFFQARALNPE